MILLKYKNILVQNKNLFVMQLILLQKLLLHLKIKKKYYIKFAGTLSLNIKKTIRHLKFKINTI